MNNPSDQQLLLAYARGRSEAAFSELVRRHIDLVYSAALRMVHDPHTADDVTQMTFVALAQNASRLAGHPVLSGWLHCTTRNLVTKTLRCDARRRSREHEAAALHILLHSEAEVPWETLAPELDAALGELEIPLIIKALKR